MQFPDLSDARKPPLAWLLAASAGAIAGAVLTAHFVASAAPSGLPGAVRGALSWLQVRAAHAHYPAVDLAEIAEKTTASVVNISTTKILRGKEAPEDQLSPFLDDPFFRRFFQSPPGQGIPRERRAKSLGSGVIVDARGTVLTNNHVVEGADEIKVTLSDKREFDAELVGADPQSDVAVLRILGEPDGLSALPFGDSSTLRLADTVLAIGNPFGVGQTVTMGIVSATGRVDLGIADYENFIQTDAAINPGNSGGALLNVRGELVGINTAIVSRSGGYQGIGFAIPSNMARQIMTSLEETGRVERGWLGVAIQNLDRDIAEAMGMEQARGVLVADLTADGPAEKAGLERGDVILSVDERDVNSTGELRNVIASQRSGTKVAVQVQRGAGTRTIQVELGTLPDELGGTPEAPAAPSSGLLGGVGASDLDDRVRRKFEIADDIERGAVLVRVQPGSALARSGIRPGDVVLKIDRRVVEDADGFRQRVEELRDADSALLLVARSGGTLFVLVKK